MCSVKLLLTTPTHPWEENREETKGRFRKRVVLANVPSFRFLVPGNIRMYPRSGFWCRGNIRTFPRSGFGYRGTSAKTTLLETTLLRTPKRIPMPARSGPLKLLLLVEEVKPQGLEFWEGCRGVAPQGKENSFNNATQHLVRSYLVLVPNTSAAKIITKNLFTKLIFRGNQFCNYCRALCIQLERKS